MRQISIVKQTLVLFFLPTLLAAGPQGGVHPAKAEFKDFQEWRAVNPGQVSLKDFSPFRAVYKRNYTQGSGPKKGEPRTDRVIITAEAVGWDGHQAIHFSMVDSGEVHYDDTNGRTFSLYFDAKTLAMLLEMGPVPGSAKDYYTLRVLEDKLVGTFVTTDKGEAQNQIAPTSAPGFGAPAPWILASMDLTKGKRIRFEPAYSVGLGVLNTKSPFRVSGQQKIKSEGGQSFQVWVVESVSNLKSPWVQRTMITDKPPYLIRRESVNKDSGQTRVYMDLLNFQSFAR